MPSAVDGAFARWLADGAGDLLLRLRDEMGFDDPTALRKAGDKRVARLHHRRCWPEHRPADAVLSEEGVRDDPARLDAERVWIVDPLDGTREFGEEGRTDWAVHVALCGPRSSPAPSRLAAAAVALPAQRRVIGTDFPPTYPPMSPQRGRRAGRAAVRGQPHPPAGGPARSWPRSSAPRPCRWARPAPRSPR